MKEILSIVAGILICIAVSLYIGKITITNEEVSLERPMMCVGAMLIMLGFLMFIVGIANEN